MYRDNSLIPSDAVRLAALGGLWREPRRYAELATEVRHFTSRIVGPSLDLLAPSIELLRLEGLIEAVAGPDRGSASAEAANALMTLTAAGRAELNRLLTANLRGPLGEINKLIIALKLRFIEALAPAERALQADVLAESCEQELARLRDLRGRHAGAPGHLVEWLDHDIAQVEARLAWFHALKDRL
jgi:DNA-binding PadR family transcriptional regulator